MTERLFDHQARIPCGAGLGQGRRHRDRAVEGYIGTVCERDAIVFTRSHQSVSINQATSRARSRCGALHASQYVMLTKSELGAKPSEFYSEPIPLTLGLALMSHTDRWRSPFAPTGACRTLAVISTEGYDQVAGMMHIDRKFMALHLLKREKTDPHRRRRERSRRICRSELVNVRRNGME